MKPIPAEVQPAITEVQIINRWDAATGREERAEKSLAEIRLEKGRILVEARTMFPARGRTDGAWGKLLAKLRVEERTARNYMALAGYVEATGKTENVSAIPVYAEAGIVKPPKAEPRELQELTFAEPRDVAPQVVSAPPDDDPGPLLGTVEQMIASSRSLLSQAERLDAFARQGARIAMQEHAVQGVRLGLIAAKTSIEKALRMMGWEN